MVFELVVDEEDQKKTKQREKGDKEGRFYFLVVGIRLNHVNK